MNASFFKKNTKYVVVKTFSSHTCMFERYDVLTYIGEGFSRYDDCYIYEFIDENGNHKEITNYNEGSPELQGLFNLYDS